MPTAHTLLKDLIEKMASRSRVGYGKELPGELDHLFRQIAMHVRVSSPAGVASLVAAVPDALGPFVLGFSGRMSTWALRSRDAELIHCAMMAHVLEDFRTDPRENIRQLALVHHVAERLGEEPGVAFREAAALACESTSHFIVQFLSRSPEMRSIEVMGLEPFDGPEGPSFRPVKR